MDGYDLDATTVVRAEHRERLEHLCRYLLRPPLVDRCLTVDMLLHEADEDASIAPRLGASDGELDRVVARVEEHIAIDTLAHELAEGWHRLAIERIALRDPLRHRAGVGRLRRMLEAHLSAEERDLFPRIDALAERDRLEIILEMEQRRAET